jgi:hypothetical protein
MTKKLFTARVTYDYVVVAENEEEADEVARGYLKDALSDMSIYDVDIDVEEGIHSWGWDEDCIPYGGDGNTRTKEYVQSQES